VLQLLPRGPDQHVAHEEGMVRASANHSYAYPVALIPASESIDDVDAVPGVEIVDGTLTVDAPDLVEMLARETDAHVTVFLMGRWRFNRPADAGKPSQARHVQGCAS
jgi:hypothetical protein